MGMIVSLTFREGSQRLFIYLSMVPYTENIDLCLMARGSA